MKLWTVKHTDIAGQRRRMCVAARTNGDAMDCAERMFGDARAMSALRVPAPARHQGRRA